MSQSGGSVRTGIVLAVGAALLTVLVVWGLGRGVDSPAGEDPLTSEALEHVQSEDLSSPTSSGIGKGRERTEGLDQEQEGIEGPALVPKRDDQVVYESSLDYLRSYWGDQWPDLQAELEANYPDRLRRYQDLQLTQDLIPPPLSEIHDELRVRLLEEFDSNRSVIARQIDADAWPEALTPDFLVERVGADPSELDAQILARAQKVADQYREDLRVARDEFLAEARAAVEREAGAGAYVAWPLLHVGAGRLPSGAAPERHAEGSDVSLLISYRGLWIISLNLRAVENPHVHELREVAAHLGRRRLRDLWGVL